MSRLPMLIPAVCLFAVPLQSQAASASGRKREPAAVAAPFDLTWAAVEKVVRGDRIHDPLRVVEEAAGYRKARWTMRIPSEDFRAASWASCQSGAEAAVAPRSGVVTLVVRGDSTGATVAVSVEWSAQDPNEMQRVMVCRTFEEYEKDIEKNVRKTAERAARR